MSNSADRTHLGEEWAGWSKHKHDAGKDGKKKDKKGKARPTEAAVAARYDGGDAAGVQPTRETPKSKGMPKETKAMKDTKDAKDGKDSKASKDSKVAKTLDSVERAADIDGAGLSEMQRRLQRAAESSGKLSDVWDEPVEDLLRFRPGIRVADIDGASLPGFGGGKGDAERFIELSSSQIAFYQELLYANGVDGGKRRMLVVLQGMDASGKGGIVRHVFHQGNPMGIGYHGFGKPTEEELAHDYLWRIRRELPKNGWIKVFDRSHYEDIVMPHVYGTYPESVWRARYDEINEFENGLLDDGCSIIKIFLVVSRDCQKKHFLGRLDDPCKYWKFDPSDLDARARWDDYMDAWQEVFEKTSTRRAPWYLVPADHRWYSRAVVSELLRVGLRDMGLNWPPAHFDMTEARRRLREE